MLELSKLSTFIRGDDYSRIALVIGQCLVDRDILKLTSQNNLTRRPVMLDNIRDFLKEPLPRRVLFFDDMLTPNLIRVLYWLGLLAVIWTGIGNFFSNGFFGMFEALVYVLGGVIALRVMAELVMLLFKINQNLEKIAENSEQGNSVKQGLDEV
jgi:uncharacterized membrane protein